MSSLTPARVTSGEPPRWRRWLVCTGLVIGCGVLGARAVELGTTERDFLEREARARHLRVDVVAAHRGKLLDRNGEPLAVSSPLPTLTLDPVLFDGDANDLAIIARLLELRPDFLRARVARAKEAGKRFVYLRRRVHPAQADAVLATEVAGLGLESETRRFYPAGETMAHLIGFTDGEDVGRSGMERAFEQRLGAVPGARRVVRDRYDNTVDVVESLREPQHGRDVTLSIDRGVQYIAHRALKAGVKRAKASAGAMVIIDIERNEVLAMVNYPTYNPNDPGDRKPARYRNRAALDVFEPGSTIKPFTVAAALDTGRITPDFTVDTSPGWMRISRHTVRDFRDYGELDVADILRRSSNVGVVHVALEMEPARQWAMLDALGFGKATSAGVPGEVNGRLTHYESWREARRMTLSYGYGLSTTLLQLTQAYATLGRFGRVEPVHLTPTDAARAPSRGRIERPEKRAMSEHTARTVLKMLERVTAAGGTAPLSRISGYRVAGKTGTVRKLKDGKYLEKRYLSLFAGVVPATRPRFAAAVVIDDPRGKDYYGGLLAAPVFSQALEGALRIYGIAPDDLPVPALVEANDAKSAPAKPSPFMHSVSLGALVSERRELLRTLAPQAVPAVVSADAGEATGESKERVQ